MISVVFTFCPFVINSPTSLVNDGMKIELFTFCTIVGDGEGKGSKSGFSEPGFVKLTDNIGLDDRDDGDGDLVDICLFTSHFPVAKLH